VYLKINSILYFIDTFCSSVRGQLPLVGHLLCVTADFILALRNNLQDKIRLNIKQTKISDTYMEDFN